MSALADTAPQRISHRVIEALVEARTQVDILQGRLGIKDEGHGTLAIIDAALAEVEREGARP